MNTTDKGQEASEAHLWVCSGEQIGRRYALDAPRYRLGRNSDLEIPLDDERASQRHAAIELEQGTHYITDTGSTNGTFVNNKRIDTPTPLKDGDLVQIGETVFEYVSYEHRNLTINVGDGDSNVQPRLRSEARDALRQARGSGGNTMDIPGRSLVPVQRTGGGVSMQTQSGYPNHLAYPPAYPDQRGTYLDDDEGGFDFRLLLARAKTVIAFFMPYWRSILIISLLCAIVGAATIYLRPPPQEAVFEIDLVPEASQNPLGQFRGNATFFRSAEQSFRSSRLITETLAKLGVKNPTPEEVNSVQEHLAFNTVGPPTPNTYSGSFTDTDGDYAVKYMKAHVDTFLETEVERVLKVIKSESDFLTKQLEITTKKLKTTESALLAFKQDNIDGMPAQATQNYDLYFRLKQEKSRAQSELARASAQRAQLRRRMKEEKRMVDYEELGNSYNSAIAQKRRDLATAQASGQGPAHPAVVRLKRELKELEKLARNARNNPAVSQRLNPLYLRIKNDLQNTDVDVRVARNELARINKEMKRVRSLVKKLPELEAKHSDLTRSYDATKENYNRLLNQLNTAKVQLEYERASAAARYSIITPPQLKYQPMLRRMLQRGMLGGIAGMVLALGLTALRRFRQHPVAAVDASDEKGLAPIAEDTSELAEYSDDLDEDLTGDPDEDELA